MGATTVDIPHFSTVKTFYCALLQAAAATMHDGVNSSVYSKHALSGVNQLWLNTLRLLTVSDKLDFFLSMVINIAVIALD